MEILSSMLSWGDFQQKLAEALNIYPTSLRAQYRFSSENKDSLPCDLTSQQQFTTMLLRLRPLVVPAMLTNGQRSARKMKAVAVQIFNKGDDPVQNNIKVCSTFARGHN